MQPEVMLPDMRRRLCFDHGDYAKSMNKKRRCVDSIKLRTGIETSAASAFQAASR